jgi:4-amino-4-deoxy-L-arabinose transferase-like glycosyltransferase
MTLSPGRTGGLLFLLGLALYLPALGARDMWNPDEPRYAQVAREMSDGGELLVPRLNGLTYMQKPPLFFWSIMAAGRVMGRIDETAARLPSALAAAGTIALTYAIGRRLLSRRAGLLAALVLATTGKIYWQARFAQIDMVLTFLVALGVACWTRGYVERDPRWYPFFFVATGLATLAKGPAGFLPPLLGILAFLVLTRDREAFRALGLWRGVLLWALVVAVWFLPASLQAGGGYGAEIGLRQTVARYFSPWLHQSPWYHYLEVLPGDFLPWSLLLPTAAVVAWREARADRGVLLAACWVGATLLFFSLSPAKRGVYVLTMYPGLALLVGAALDRIAATWPRYRWWLAAPAAALAVTAASGAVWLLVSPPHGRGLVAMGEAFFARAAVVLFVLGAGAGAASCLVLRSRLRAAVGVALAVFAGVLVAIGVDLLPRLNRITSLRPIAEVVTREVPPGVRYGVYPYLQTPILFYSDHFAEELETEDELNAFLARDGRRWLVVRGRVARELAARLPRPVAEVGVPHSENWFDLFELR